MRYGIIFILDIIWCACHCHSLSIGKQLADLDTVPVLTTTHYNQFVMNGLNSEIVRHRNRNH